uniref:NADH-ubiquinone oxidoreductase chain 4L n=1 Tax=Tettigades sarcinatrix TaxID=2219937 RepID=A0A3S5GLC9_9HEMI|nr:NADH dehydrogenase subunit 4L [Tettigades sarcinatrix]AWV84442.1 NADH dehydrogenase subunit 4L [Tettigades sarcinatrix]
MNMNLFCYLMMYCSGIVSLCLARKHIMLSLLSLEFIILSLFCIFSITVTIMISESYMMLMFLTFSVCEGVVGLSILVMMIRSHGNDYLSSINLSLC